MSGPREVSAPRMMSARGGSAPGGCGIPACTEADPPGQTDTCKNITFATSLRTVKIQYINQSVNTLIEVPSHR